MATDPVNSLPELPPEEPTRWRRLWRYSRALLAPVLIWLLLMGTLIRPVLGWLDSEQTFDRSALQEWLDEARNADNTLSELVEAYERSALRYSELRQANDKPPDPDAFLHFLAVQHQTAVKRAEIKQHLRALGEPPTKMYPGQLPLFPVIFRLEVHFGKTLAETESIRLPGGAALNEPIFWDSGLEPSSGQYREAMFDLRGESDRGRVLARYQLRAWNKRQQDEQVKARRARQLALLAIGASILGLGWLMLLQSDEREHQRQRQLARDALAEAKEQRLEQQRQHSEMERQLLEQRLATQAAERKALELKSHLYASIGIMAGSYAHNIKNLLVRPNDLLRRCLERTDSSPEAERMLREVQQTLGTVTERLQQILLTVRRDPSRSRMATLDLNSVARVLGETWKELAADRWQLDLRLELSEEQLWIGGDESHLQQAVENLLFNARDATFERRNQLRDQARKGEGLDGPARKQALIAAAAWRGKATVRTRRQGNELILEVEDNGAGMTDEIKKRCTETHFSTKRDNALYEGHSTGMGLGLSFVGAILENHEARLTIESSPGQGALFCMRFHESSRTTSGTEPRLDPLTRNEP